MQGDGGRKFKVGTGREKEKERGREREILQVSGGGVGSWVAFSA